MTPDEADRLAHHVNLERPEWPVASLRTLIIKKLAGKPYRDALHAFIDCAADPDTNTPARVLEAGPWWGTRVADARDKPAYYGPTAQLCKEPIALEDGTPSRCNLLIHPDEEHTCRRPVNRVRDQIIAEARQALAERQGEQERQEAETEQRRKEAAA